MARWISALTLAVITCSGALWGQGPVQSDAASMEKKIAAILARSAKPATKSGSQVRISFTDREANAYFKLRGAAFLPEGVVDPQVIIGPEGQVRARAIVDLDLALKPKQRSWLDPLAWLGGKVEVTAAGAVEAAGGRGTFALGSATLAGVAVPKVVLQELVSYFTRAPERPEGFQLDAPFGLPAGIRSVETRPGAATIVQ